MNSLQLVPDPSSIPLPFPSPRKEETSDDNNDTDVGAKLGQMRLERQRVYSGPSSEQDQKSKKKKKKKESKRKQKQAASVTQNDEAVATEQPSVPPKYAAQRRNVMVPVTDPPPNCILSPPITVEKRRDAVVRNGKNGPSSAPPSTDGVHCEENAPDTQGAAEGGKKKRKRKKRSSKVPPKEEVPAERAEQRSSPTLRLGVELSCSGKKAKVPSRKSMKLAAIRNHQQQQHPPRPFFRPHITPGSVEHGIESGVLVRGQLRVNARDPGQCWVVDISGREEVEYLILGAKDRNRAMHGDAVVLRVKSREQWVLRDRVYQGWKEDNAAITDGEDGSPDGPHRDMSAEVTVTIAEESSTVIELEEEMDVVVEEESTLAAEESEEIGLDSDSDKRQVYSRDLLVTILSQISPNGNLTKRLDSTPSGSGVESRVRSVRRPNFHTLRFIAEKESVPDELLHKTAEVVCIEQRSRARCRAVGLLKAAEKGYDIFVPNDAKTPLMKIPPEQLPSGFRKRPQDFASFLFAAEFDDEWAADCNMATGTLLRQLGCAGDLEAETEGLLMANNVDYREFPDELMQSLPACVVQDGDQWRISEAEMTGRRDFRGETVFTIDPATARDLDDALHIKATTTANGAEAWEVGVHIADVSYFVCEGTELDEWAADRATSVYLVDRVIPMLPRPLCENLCSLNPGEDKLTFSVVWMMDRKGQILDEWFGRSVIRSCAKLAYDHAEEIIKRDGDWPPTPGDEELPVKIFNSKAPSDVRHSVLRLNYVARQLRERRFAGGALKLDQPKLKFKLDADTGAPYGLALDERGEANFLVEEFMLLANMAVARRIYEAFPEIALLRRHPPPNARTLAEMMEKSTAINYPVSGSNSFELNRCLQAYGAQPELQSTVMPFLHKLVMRSMRLAKYFCPGFYKDRRMDEEDEGDGRGGDGGKEQWFRHYALSCDLYTHFTSPIRRYPDVIVHRLLAASLGYAPVPAIDAKKMEKIAERCNETKSAARVVSEGSSEFFFDELIKVVGRLEASGVVIGVFENAFDVLLLDYGLTRRVYLSKLPTLANAQFRKGRVFSSLHLTFTVQQGKEEGEKQTSIKGTSIKVLTSVKVVLTPSSSKSPLGVRHIATILP